jgi:AcrR family transcriptional regulator
MTQPTVPRSRGAATRQRLTAAALDLFAARGLHATTTALLAERTGIAEGTIYRHFRSKETLYNEVTRQVWERGLTLLVDESAEGPATAREQLNGAARRLFGEAQRSSATIRLLLGPVEREVLDEPAQSAAERFRQGVVQLVVTGKQSGSIRAGTAELWASIWLAIVGFVCERVAEGEWAPDHPNVGMALDAAWAAISRDPSMPVPGPASAT